jgi:hypothetical protein
MKFSEAYHPWDYVDERQRADLLAAMVRERAAMRAHRDYTRSTTEECERYELDSDDQGNPTGGTCLHRVLAGKLMPTETCPRCQEVIRLKGERYRARQEFVKVRDRIWRRLWRLVGKMPD